MSPKRHLKSLKARFKRILSDREVSKSHEFNDSASSISSDKKMVSSPSRFKKKKSSSSRSSVNSKTKAGPSKVKSESSSSSSSDDNMRGSPSEVKKKKKSPSSESSLDNQRRKLSKSIKKLHLIGLESRLKLPLNETSQVSPSSKLFASDSKLLQEKDRDQQGSRRGLWSTTMSPTTSTETSSPALPRYSFSLNDSSAPSSPGRPDKSKASEELSALQSSYDQERNSRAQQKVSSPKVKRIQSAFLDEERGVWRCRNCEWIYPNPNPSARHRRDHKKHCGEILNVQKWLSVVNLVDQDIQGRIEEHEEGHRPGVLEVDTEEGKAPISSEQDQEGILTSLDSEEDSGFEDMSVQKPMDDTESAMEVEEPSDFVNADSPVDHGEATEGTAYRDHVSKSDADTGEGNSRSIESPVVGDASSEVAENDPEGQETQESDGNGNLGNGDLVGVGVQEEEEQGNVEGTEEPKKEQEVDVMAPSQDEVTEEDHPEESIIEELENSEVQQWAGGTDDSEALTRGESQDKTQFYEGKDVPSIENPGQLHVGQDEAIPTKPVEDATVESSGLAEEVQEIEDNTSSSGAHKNSGVDSENEKSDVKQEVIASTSDREITSHQDGEDSFSPIADGNHENGDLTDSKILKPDSEIVSVNEFNVVNPKITIPDEYTGESSSPASDSSVTRFGAPRSLLGIKKSASPSSPSSSSSSSEDSDSDRGTSHHDEKTPLSGFRKPNISQEKGSPDARSVEETTMQGGISDGPAPPTLRKRLEISMPETVEEPHSPLTPTITTTITTTMQSPGTPGTSTSTFEQVGIVSGAIKDAGFKARQMYWAEITSSDVLEGPRKSFESKKTPPLKHRVELGDNALSATTTGVTTYESNDPFEDEDQGQIKTEVLVSEGSTPVSTPASVASSSTSYTVSVASTLSVASSSTSHPASVASTSTLPVYVANSTNLHPVSVASSSSSHPAVEYEVERVIHEQNSHDILCPVCGSCITKRVILRKRKRTQILKYDPKWEDPIAEPETPILVAPVEPEPESESWGCLACFSFFFRREVREPEPNMASDVGPRERTPCLQIVFPTFPWGPRYTVENPDLVERLLPPPSKPAPAPPVEIQVPTTPEGDEERVSCFSYLLKSKSQPVPDVPQPEATPQVPAPAPEEPTAVEQTVVEPDLEPAIPLQEKVQEPPVAPAPEVPVEVPQVPREIVEEPKEISPPVVLTPKENIAVKIEITPVAPPRIDPDIAPVSESEINSANKPVYERVKSGYVDKPGVRMIVKKETPQLVPSLPEVFPSGRDDRVECFQLLLPTFPWGPPTQEIVKTEVEAPVIEPPVPDPPIVVPSDNETHAEEKKPDSECLPKSLLKIRWRPSKAIVEPAGTDEDSGTPAVEVPSPPEEQPQQEQTPSEPARKEDSRCLPLKIPKFSRKYQGTVSKSEPTPGIDQQTWKYRTYPNTHLLSLMLSSPTIKVPAPGFDVVQPENEESPDVVPEPEQPDGRTIHVVPVDDDEEVVVPAVVVVEPAPMGQVDDRKCAPANCIPLLLPEFPWGPPVQELPVEVSTSCSTVIDMLLPSFKWGSNTVEIPPTEPEVPREAIPVPQKETDPFELPVSVRAVPETPPSTSYGESVEQEITPKDEYSSYKREVNRVVGHVVKVTTIVNIKNRIEQSIEVQKNVTHFETQFDANNHMLKSEELKAEDLQRPEKETPDSVDEEPEEETPLIRKKKEEKPQTAAIAEVLLTKATTVEKPAPAVVIVTPAPKHGDHEIQCSCLPFDLPKLSWSWETPARRTDDELTRPLLHQDQQLPVTYQPQDVTPPTVILDMPTAPVGGTAPVSESLEIVKSIVYGGLDTTLVSLGVVASATGGDANTRTVIAMGLANVVFTFIAFLSAISVMYQSDFAQFKRVVGPSYRLNGFIAAFSYLFFGLLSPITYGFTFRHETNRDYKMAATCLVALVCLVLLGWAKARVTSQNAYKLISTLITTGFIGAIACYQAGDYVSWLLEKIGFDSV